MLLIETNLSAFDGIMYSYNGMEMDSIMLIHKAIQMHIQCTPKG